MKRSRLGPRLAFAASVALAFYAGLSVEHLAVASRKGASPPYKPLDVFSDVLAHVENSYVEPVEERELVYAAVEGMVNRLDPHSAFMRPEVYRDMRDETSGEYDGIGVEVTFVRGDLTVVSPLADSPGERAGIRPGDRILSIDGESTREMTLPDATGRFKGPVGSKVVLEVMREGFGSPQKLTLIRDRVRAQSVEWRVVDPSHRYVHVRVKSFSDRTDRAVARALDEARTTLKADIGGLVLDLRNNPGGLLEQGVKVADLFLASGVIVSMEGRGGRNVEVERAREKETEPRYPMIVLVNKGTASASEIVAGALQDQGRAVIMGTPTFGKGTVQTIIELDDGSGLKLTTARYFTPKHRSIQEMGISPDMVVAEPSAGAVADAGRRERDLERHLENEAVPASLAPALEDYQLKTAVDYLKTVGLFDGPEKAGRQRRGVATTR